MTYTLGLGILGGPSQWYLPGTDIAPLPLPPAGAPPPVPGAIAELLVGPIPAGTILGGLVQVTDGPAGILVDVLGAWNSVKNGSFASDQAERLTMSGFVHADVALGGGGDSFVLLEGAKRGNVVTAEGEDIVLVQVATNGATWVNEFRVNVGAGDDVVTVGALDIAGRAAAGDATFAATTNGAGAFTGSDAGTMAYVLLGAGDDRFLGLGASRDDVRGGAGEDVLAAGRGDDVLAGGEGADIFLFENGGGADRVADFTVGEDRLVFLGLGIDALQAILDAATAEEGGTLLTHGGDSVFLAGIAPETLSLSDPV
jgi:Ca2+-binding RTX toxin-like protein